MRLVFLLMAGKSFRGMLELLGRIPPAWGSPPPLMMNRVGSAAFSLWRSNLADSRTASLIASAELQKEAWLKFGLRSPLARFWQRDTSQELHNQIFLLLLFRFCSKNNCHMNCCTPSRYSPKSSAGNWNN